MKPLLILLTVLLPVAAYADTIAIIGTGDVAGALGPEFAAQGHTVVYGSRDPDRPSVAELVERTGSRASATTPAAAVVGADIVVLAVPGLLVGQITESLGDLSGRIIIDPTNPLERSASGFRHAVDSSNAEIVQAAAPGARVVKAFNTLNWQTMIDPSAAGGPVSIPLVGDDERAKAVVAELADGMGLSPIDLGGLEHARWVEGMLVLWINNRYGPRQSFDYYLRPTP
jgi:predicted dinucleotide-binding enzyme